MATKAREHAADPTVDKPMGGLVPRKDDGIVKKPADPGAAAASATAGGVKGLGAAPPPPPEQGGPVDVSPAPADGSGMGGMGGGMFGMGGMGMGGMGMGGMGGMMGGGFGGGLGGLGGLGGGPATAGGRSVPLAPPAHGRTAPAKAGKGKDADGAAERDQAAGQLTAGSFDDNRDIAVWHRFLNRLTKQGTAHDLAPRFHGRRVTIVIKDPEGNPVDNASVTVRAGNAVLHLKSRTDGRAVIVTPWDGLPPDVAWTVTATPPDGGPAITGTCPPESERLALSLLETPTPVSRVLDLALVIDTTGSMGDELEYVKSEMKSIASAVRKQYPDAVQRYALIVYRDAGDEYVTRTYPFTESLAQLLAGIQAQRADGGGDEPEAVHKAMEAAEKLKWSSTRATRVLIHLADAPPHAEQFQRSLKAVDRLRKRGIAIYPVACSGYSADCEFHMRRAPSSPAASSCS